MQKLNFPDYSFRFKNRENQALIFDVVRKKFVVLQPEEWVRQHVVHFLITEKQFPVSHINVEKQLVLHHTKKRYDIVVYNAEGEVVIIVECKAPNIQITQDTFDQVARYNHVAQARYIMVTNGLDHYYCKVNPKADAYDFLKELPPYHKK